MLQGENAEMTKPGVIVKIQQQRPRDEEDKPNQCQQNSSEDRANRIGYQVDRAIGVDVLVDNPAPPPPQLNQLS
jgi:hypothetical protein